jgi:hypothetical protein
MRKNSQDPRACDSDRASGLAHDVSAHTSQRYSPVHPSVVILALNKKAAWSKTSKHVNVRPSLRSQLHDEPPMPRACPLFLAGDDTPTTSVWGSHYYRCVLSLCHRIWQFFERCGGTRYWMGIDAWKPDARTGHGLMHPREWSMVHIGLAPCKDRAKLIGYADSLAR